MNETTKDLESIHVSRKANEVSIVENNSVVTECINEKEPERDINPPWGWNFKGLLYTHRTILS
jgi:hypothetical protein